MQRWATKKKLQRYLDSGYVQVTKNKKPVTRFEGDKQMFLIEVPKKKATPKKKDKKDK